VPYVNENGFKSNFLRLVDTAGQSSELHVARVVVAAGALQSVALLERSISIVNLESRGVIGKYLMEHLEGFVGYLDFKSEESRDKFLEQFTPRYLSESAEGLVGAGLSFQPDILNTLKLSTFHLEFYSERSYPLIEDWDFLFLRRCGFTNMFAFTNRMYRFLSERLTGLKKPRFRISVWVKAEEIPFSLSNTRFDSNSGRVIYEHYVSRHSTSLLKRDLEEIAPGLQDIAAATFRIRPRIRFFTDG